jgi:predicted transcriptional regulator
VMQKRALFVCVARLACFIGACCVGACSTGKQEAASLIAATDRFHKAENVDKPDRADAIARVVCTEAEVCEAKRVCESASKSTARALVLKAEVERGLAALEQGALARTDDAAAALPEKLDEAERLLNLGHEAMPACDQKILALRARYDL